MISIGYLEVKLNLSQTYLELSQIKEAKERVLPESPKEQQALLPGLEISLSLLERYIPLDQIEVKEEYREETEEEKEIREEKRVRGLISKLRRKHSSHSIATRLEVSLQESRSKKVCRDCGVSLDPDKPLRLEVVNANRDGKTALIEADPDSIFLTLKWPDSPEDYWYQCVFCHEIMEEQMLQLRWESWWRDIKKANKSRGPILASHNSRKPTFPVWLSAYRETQRRPAKRPSSLDRLESTLDRYRKQ